MIFCQPLIIYFCYREWVEEQTLDKIPIAFDMEWPVDYSSSQCRTALIQLCAKLDVCHLFQVSGLRKLPNALITLLLHSKVVLHGNRIKKYKLMWKIL